MLKLRLLFKKRQILVHTITFIALGFLLAIVVTRIDHDALGIIDNIPKIFTTTPSMAKNILTTLAGSLLTITTFTFSTVLTVLSIYSSNFTPRIVENFLHKKITMQVLGLFVGAFIYSILTLWKVRLNQERSVISGTVAVFMSIICILYFVYFVREVVNSVQTTQVIRQLTNDANDAIDKARAMIDEDKSYKDSGIDTSQEPYILHSPTSGYFEGVDYERLSSLLKKYIGHMHILPMLGDYVPEGSPIARFWIDKEEEFQEAVEDDSSGPPENLEDCFLIQHEREALTDFQFCITKIIEICVRAVSTGIGDPNTAIMGVHRLGECLGKIAAVEPVPNVIRSSEKFMITTHFFILKNILHLSFEQILHYCRDDVSVNRAVLQTLYTIYSNAHPKNKKAILDFENYAFEHMKIGLKHEVDIQKLEDVRIHEQEEEQSELDSGRDAN
ncbi:MAG: DUF2254 domain-containing protein [Fastidiosipilaceae bacterium]|jgi:uncharacterized membrane protein|nr:DUF2254 domain-containing protein [Clostridiaceae bacterium]